MIKTAKKIARTKGIKHVILLVSLLTSIGMMLFSQSAYAFGETSFGGNLMFQYTYPFGCNAQYSPFYVDAGPNTYEPKGFGEISASSDHVTGNTTNGVEILGLVETQKTSESCYMWVLYKQVEITTSVFSYFGTSELPSF
ncbi:MAG: hypothetical protein ACI88L_000346 [Candidatus Paceibacteria bacterium]|jgi:hypothetical protein